MTTHARLSAFVAVADTGSIHAAARQCFLTDSSVSSAVAALARELGVELVTKRGRGIVVTEAGEIYAGYARTILSLHREGVAAARGRLDPERGAVRIAAVSTVGDHVLPVALADFRRHYPEVSLALQIGTREMVWESLRRHEADLVVAGRPPEHSGLTIHASRANVLVVVAAPAASGQPLGTATWLLREPGSGTRATVEAVLSALNIEPPRLVLGSTAALVAAAAAGLGLALVPCDAVRGAVQGGHLVVVPVPSTPLARPWHAVTNPNPSPTAVLFVRHLLREQGRSGRPGWAVADPAAVSAGR